MAPLNVAHRGARSVAPENTLPAAEKGLELGADLWELDVQLTADGELIVIHDDTLPRTSDAQSVFPTREPWRVIDFTLAEIRRLDFGSWYNAEDPFGQIAAGTVGPAEQRSFVGVRAPTLGEALEWTRDAAWRVNVELKGLAGGPGERDFVERVIALIRDLGMTDAVIISSFDHSYVRRARQAAPELPAAVLTAEPLANAAEYVRSLGAEAYNPGREAVAADEIPAFRRAGLDVYVWTVNEPDEMRTFADAGVTGIITDFPQRLGPLLYPPGEH